eukprot:5717430-Amphidinium_carterae.1
MRCDVSKIWGMGSHSTHMPLTGHNIESARTQHEVEHHRSYDVVSIHLRVEWKDAATGSLVPDTAWRGRAKSSVND